MKPKTLLALALLAVGLLYLAGTLAPPRRGRVTIEDVPT